MLYHYTGMKGLNGILESKRLWLVSSQSMSDITDRFYGNLFSTVALLKSEDQDIKLLREHLTAQDIIDINMQTFQVDFYSASFCDRSDNDYLWEKYADSNKGVCIGIDDTYLNNFFLATIREKFNYLEGDEESNVKNDLLNQRKVLYHYPVGDFEKIVKLLRPDDYTLSNNANVYKDWLFFTICILAGIVKAKKFDKEDEIRLLFQNRYSDEYIKHCGIYALEKMRMAKAFELLGIDKEIMGKENRRMELNLTEAFKSDLIQTITIGNDFDGNIEDLKTRIKEFGLTETKLLNRKGVVL